MHQCTLCIGSDVRAYTLPARNYRYNEFYQFLAHWVNSHVVVYIGACTPRPRGLFMCMHAQPWSDIHTHVWLIDTISFHLGYNFYGKLSNFKI